PEVDPAFEIRIVSGHVLGADLIVEAGSRPAHGGGDVITGLEFADVRSNLLDTAKTLVAHNEVIVSGRRCAVFTAIDLLVCAVHSNAKDFDEDSAAVRNIVQRWVRYFTQMNAVRFSRKDCYRFHFLLPSDSFTNKDK